MILTELSIKRPAFSWVLSLILVLFGSFVFWKLPVRELPSGLQPPVVQVNVEYASASSQIIDEEVTQVLEEVIGGAEGIKNIDSSSENGKTVSLGTLELDSTGSGSESNYTLSGGTHTFNVTPRPLTFTSSRNYDGTTTANTPGLTYTFGNLVSGESLVLSGSGTVASKDVSAGTQNITLGTIALADNTGVASNYSLTSGTMNVTQTQVNLTGNKVYDNSETLNNSIVSVASGLIGIETLGLSGDVVTNSSNVGTYLESANQLNSGSTTIALTNGSNGGLSNNYIINELSLIHI